MSNTRLSSDPAPPEGETCLKGLEDATTLFHDATCELENAVQVIQNAIYELEGTGTGVLQKETMLAALQVRALCRKLNRLIEERIAGIGRKQQAAGAPPAYTGGGRTRGNHTPGTAARLRVQIRRENTGMYSCDVICPACGSVQGSCIVQRLEACRRTTMEFIRRRGINFCQFCGQKLSEEDGEAVTWNLQIQKRSGR